jgi:hypothetical protein
MNTETTNAASRCTEQQHVGFAHIGSTIETVFSDGRRTRVTVNTPLACAEANRLIMTGRWHVVLKPNAQ